MNMDPAGSVYFTLGTYLLVYMLIGVACLGTASYVMGRLFPRIRALGSVSVTGPDDRGDLHLAHGRPV